VERHRGPPRAHNNGLEDPFLQMRIATLSTSYKGMSVFPYQWFAYSALRHLKRSRPEDYDAALVSLAETFDGFGPEAMELLPAVDGVREPTICRHPVTSARPAGVAQARRSR
jgi:hypothetical protein